MTVIVASNKIQYSSDAGTQATNTLYVLKKTINMTESYTGSWRIVFDLGLLFGSAAYGQIRRNNGIYGTERIISTTGFYTTFSEDFTNISINAGDAIQLWQKANTGSGSTAQNFRIEFDIPRLRVMIID